MISPKAVQAARLTHGHRALPSFHFIVFVIMMLGGVLLTGAQVIAQTGALNHSPTDLLKKYLTLDLHGVRLEPLSQEALRPYVVWKEEPTWGQIVVVSGYEVPEDVKRWQVINNLDVFIPVEFRVLGSVDLETATYREQPHVQEVRFHIKAVRGIWRIVEPIVPPHVGQKRMVNYVRQALLEERQPSRADKLTTLREALKKSR